MGDRLLILFLSLSLVAARPLGSHSSWTTLPANQCPAASPSIVPTDACEETIVSCPDVADLPARAKISRATSSPHRGVIAFGTGGDGRGWYEGYGEVTRASLLDALLGEGFDVIQISWGSPTVPIGWLTGQSPDGLLGLACRYATLLDALYARHHAVGEAYCATGQSGGAGGLGYALAQYGLETILDEALLSGGPPFARIDYGCVGAPNDATWSALCSALKNPSCGTWPGVCEYVAGAEGIIDSSYAGGATPCAGVSPNASPEQRAIWYGDSVLAPTDLDVDHPSTRADFVYGGTECGIEASGGRLHLSAITSAKAETMLAGVGHAAIPTSGAGTLFTILRDQCVFRHEPPPDAGPPDSGEHPDAEPSDAVPTCNCCAECP